LRLGLGFAPATSSSDVKRWYCSNRKATLGVGLEVLAAVGGIDRGVELLVRLQQRGRHGQRVVEVGKRGTGELTRVSSTARAADSIAARCASVGDSGQGKLL